MNLQVKINNVDRTELIEWGSFTIEDSINDVVNTCDFTIKTYGDKTFKPETDLTVEVKDGADVIFAGLIIEVNIMFEKGTTFYRCRCKDWTVYFDRLLVVERYNGMTVGAIISDIISNYCVGFTSNNVVANTTIASIAFNYVPVSKCIQTLAEQINYSWYIDYNKDIHFFAKNTEQSPFNLTDTSNNFIFDSLVINYDNSQLRNDVMIRGGEKVATVSRDKRHVGDGNQTAFNTDYQFDSSPTVTVGGVTKTVGVEFLDGAGFDCYWNYEQKYIRFAVAPVASAVILFNGYPKIPIIVQVRDEASISAHGQYQFKKIDKTIKTSDQAKQFALSQLDAYGKTVRAGGFKTYEAGLSSGQTISVNLESRGIVDTFLIQRVRLSMLSFDKGIWEVEVATLRDMGIIIFLQNMLLQQTKDTVLSDTEVLEKFYAISEEADITEEITLTTKMTVDEGANVGEECLKDPFGDGVSPDFVLAPYTPTSNTDPKREFVLDNSLLA
jgi:hypothetical protein